MNKEIDFINNFKYENLSINDANYILKNFSKVFNNSKVVIWGAGAAGKFYYELCKSLKLEILFFIDKNAEKVKFISDTPVYTPEKLAKENEDITVLIAGNKSTVSSILEEIKKFNYEKNITIYDGSNFLWNTQCASCLIKCEKNENFDLVKCSLCMNQEGDCPAFNKRVNTITGGIKREEGDLDIIGYILGQNCTLNCEHCCEAIPYVRNPKFVETKNVIRDIEKIALATPFLYRVEFVGGEPFMHKGLVEIIKKTLSIKNLGYIVVFTNGTIIPNKELTEALKLPRVVVAFSGYKETLSPNLQKKIQNTKKKLISLGINYSIFNPDTRSWYDFNYYEKRDSSVDELKDFFKNCFINKCHRVFDGGLYRCPHQYSGIQLGKIEKKPNEFVDLHNCTKDELALRLKKFKKLDYMDACRYCNMPYDAPEVTPAIQIDKIL